MKTTWLILAATALTACTHASCVVLFMTQVPLAR